MALTEKQSRPRVTAVSHPERRARRAPSWSLGFALAIVAIVLFVTIFAQVVAPQPLESVAMTQRLLPPSARYVLGTDQLGRDMVSRLLYSTQTSVLIAGSATRAEVMSIRRSGFVNSTLNLGVSRFTTIRNHVLPALIAPLTVQLTLAFPTKILLESALSFLGLGIRPPDTSLGQMVGTGQQYLAFAWWIVVVPSAAIFLISLAVGIIGDYLQDRVIRNAG